MGNCGGICKSKLFGLKGDIIIEKKNSNNDTGKYLETEYIQKIILIQKNVKKYLKKKKFSKKSLIRKKHPNSSKNTKKISNIKKIKSPKKSHLTTKNLNSETKSKYITYEEDQKDSLLVPTIKTSILDNNNIFNDYLFHKLGNMDPNNKIENDPRDGPMDNIRRKYPKIKEDLSSYDGEWKNGKRDGLGILCWGEECKFMGNFEEDKVIGFGKLWQNNGDIYRGYWKDFQAEMAK